MLYAIKSAKTKLLSAISAIAGANRYPTKHKYNFAAGYGYNTALRATYGAKANNAYIQGRAAKIAISGLSLALLGQTASDYTTIAQTILQLMTIAIPIFVVIAVVRMIFRHLRDWRGWGCRK